MWGRLGYPRRALRLHQAAAASTNDHAGEVPSDVETLRALPAIGEYTAAAVPPSPTGSASPCWTRTYGGS